MIDNDDGLADGWSVINVEPKPMGQLKMEPFDYRCVFNDWHTRYLKSLEEFSAKNKAKRESAYTDKQARDAAELAELAAMEVVDMEASAIASEFLLGLRMAFKVSPEATRSLLLEILRYQK